MQYCPKCKTEYEDHVTQCSDCHVDLVPNLEDHAYMKNLIRVKVNDSEELIKYLAYSGISTIEKIEEGDAYIIQVPEEDHEKAVTYLQVYVREHMQTDDEEDYYYDEYLTEVEDSEDKVADMRSTVMTFGFVGGLLIVVAILNYLGVISIRGFDPVMLTVVMGAMGVGSIGVAIKTNNDIAGAESHGAAKEERIEAMVSSYTGKYPMATFYKDHRIKVDQVDEGALYFFVFDIIKKEVKALFPNEDDVMVNTVVERIYDMID